MGREREQTGMTRGRRERCPRGAGKRLRGRRRGRARGGQQSSEREETKAGPSQPGHQPDLSPIRARPTLAHARRHLQNSPPWELPPPPSRLPGAPPRPPSLVVSVFSAACTRIHALAAVCELAVVPRRRCHCHAGAASWQRPRAGDRSGKAGASNRSPSLAFTVSVRAREAVRRTSEPPRTPSTPLAGPATHAVTQL